MSKRIKTINLSIKQRIFATFLYILLFIVACRFFSGDWSFLQSNNEYNLLFISGALLLILGAYIAEPYFTKPVDVVANSIAIILALLGIEDTLTFTGYDYLLYGSVVVLVFAIMTILFSQFKVCEKAQHVIYDVITKIGQSKIAFSIIYVLTLLSYFTESTVEFVFFLTFWLIFIGEMIVEPFILWVSEIFSWRKEELNIMGSAIGCENPFLYKVEIDCSKHKDVCKQKGKLVHICLQSLSNESVVGIVVNEKYLLSKKWIWVYLFEENGEALKIDLKNGFKNKVFLKKSRTIFTTDNAAYNLDIGDIKKGSLKSLIESNHLYKEKDNFMGYIAEGSDINKIKFYSLLDPTDESHSQLKEGAVLKTKIYNKEVLYQIIDGRTGEERLENHDMHGYIVGIARKLGFYNENRKELDVVKWLPNIYTPIFFNKTMLRKKDQLAIGKLPETNFEIPIRDIDSLITHNTAILGILGIGKSCLTFELIKKIIDKTSVKIICLDITNEYKKELVSYLEEDIIKSDDKNSFNEINDELEFIAGEGDPKILDKSGNHRKYRECLREDLKSFLSQEIEGESDKRVRIFNPDYHRVSKGEKIGYRVITAELSQAEKTRIISEEVFKIMMDNGLEEENKAKVLIVFEEAHSLVPEWGSIANEGDKNAVNGTAKVILQGRKYGLGSFIISQRTANISKSILNQCNTIFALRVFDDTGKQFLENYVGSDYSNTLSTLEERHAVVIGRALGLKQPVIVKLNDKDGIKRNNGSSEKELTKNDMPSEL
ncbi:MAG: DUF87 domain-containing protein [Candidatus Kaiserbacteria bacterium]|nr:DUF87 domain-containing protein [Candidatus Kaiserbacteria bacterium]